MTPTPSLRPGPTARELESSLELHFVKSVRQHGGLTYKLAPTVAGIPDRLVIIAGAVHLVELKATGGRLSPIQEVQHARIREQGVTVTVLTGRHEVNAWLQKLFKAADAARLAASRGPRRTPEELAEADALGVAPAARPNAGRTVLPGATVEHLGRPADYHKSKSTRGRA